MITEAETVETARRPGIPFLRRQTGVDLSAYAQGMSAGSSVAFKGMGAFLIGTLMATAPVVAAAPVVATAGAVLGVAGTVATVTGVAHMAYNALRAKGVAREFREQDAAQGPASAFLKSTTGIELGKHLKKVNKLSMVAYAATAAVAAGIILSGPGAIALAGVGVAVAKIFSGAVMGPAAAAAKIIEANASDSSDARAPAKAASARRIVPGT